MKSIEAPDYFIQSVEEEEKIIDKVGALLKTPNLAKEMEEIKNIEDEEEQEAKREYQNSRLVKIGKSLTRKEMEKAALLFDIARMTRQLSWKKFRLENLDNDFGGAENLHYNAEKKEIEIVLEY